MNLEETIKHTRKKAEEMATKSVELFPSCEGRKYLDCAEEYYQLADWLEELKELREYKKKMKAQFLDDIENPLEPIKLSSALESEIFKYEYRTEHDPQKISPLDYTIIYALKHCLEEQLKEVE
ncbi:Uncharacterised protein [Anaerostipes hadrus]|uniref:Uncharacterized protein n=1 Tax=Anaerostipes hadrus TaxID=649756 RepID=A0A173ULY1_ANAHA|nr:hypothetical protein [Anaerostipes hadrus]CUN15346.1 Uncharacterised protein [Anaerostipes hadrus]